MLRQPCAKLGGVGLQTLHAGPVLRRQRRLDGARILCPVSREHRFGGALHLLRLPLEVRAGTTPMLGRITRQLHAVDRKHLASDEPLSIADREHGRKDRRDLIPQPADEVRDGGEVRPRVTAQGNERDLLLAGPRDGPTADDPTRVSEEHDPQ